MKYNIGYKIGDLIISDYFPKKCYYQFTCSCQTTFTGTTQTIRQKELMLSNTGKALCKKCNKKFTLTQIPDKELFQPIYKQYIRGAIKRNHKEFNITFEEALGLFKSKCHYCNCLPSNSIKIGQRIITYQGIDRLEQNIGYTSTNVVPCCKKCNYAKGVMNYKDFIDHITLIHSNVQRLEHSLVGPSGSKQEASLIIKEDDIV